MEFKDDPIAAKTTTLLRELKSKIDINISGANYNRIWELIYILVKDADQETAPLKSEIARLKQRLADCERRNITGDRV